MSMVGEKRLKSRVLAEPVLVGRERELEELRFLLDSAIEGKGSTVFVSGEAGSGKTRLVNEFLSIVKEKEIALLSGWCLSDVAVPYFPFMEAFNAYYSAQNTEEKQSELVESEGSEIKAWLLGPKPSGKHTKLQDLTPQAWQDLTFTAVTKTLLSISANKPTILFLDDVHWADSASLSLLHYVSRAVHSSRVLILATFRSEELNPDEEGHPHPLVETMRLLRREYLFQEIRLPRLGLSDVGALAEKMVGGSLQSEFAEKLTKESQGNPLFVVESLRMLSENRGLVEESGQWRLAISELGVPSRIKDVILRRVGMLKPFQRRILDLASVVGDKFDVELLGAILGVDGLEVLEALNVVAQTSCLVCSDGYLFRFDHAKSREAIFGELSPPLKRGYHAKIAEKLEAKGRTGGEIPVGDLAYHYAQAGNNAKAVEYYLASGQDALASFSNAEAVKHFSYVLQYVPDTSENSEKKRTALEGLGDAYYANCMFAKAIEVFERLADSESGKVRLRAYRKAMDAIHYSHGDNNHLMELARKAEPYAASDRLESARIRFHKAVCTRQLQSPKRRV